MKTDNTIREQYPLPQDLNVLVTVVIKGSFAAAASVLGQSPAYVSKRISVLEHTLGCRLLNRTTRSMSLTREGETVFEQGRRLLGDLDLLVDTLSTARQEPSGHIQICSSFGFGRAHVAPALAALATAYPQLEVRFEVFDRVVDLIGEGFDLEIRIGDDLPEQHISRQLAHNRRVLCATPDYLQAAGTPQTLEDLSQHHCLSLRERNSIHGVWQLEHQDGTAHNIKVRGPLSSNSGEIVLQWALLGQGIMLRSLWDIQPLLDNGTLTQVLPEYSQSANVWAIYPQRLSTSGRLRACVEFMAERFRHLSLPG